MEKKLKNRIINELRYISYSYPPKNDAKKKAKVAPATYECVGCGIWVYEGTKNIDSESFKLPSEPPKGLIKGKAYMDHIEPVDCPLTGWVDWNTYFARLFCEESNFQCLCKTCHDTKSEKENELRKKRKKSLDKSQ